MDCFGKRLTLLYACLWRFENPGNGMQCLLDMPCDAASQEAAFFMGVGLPTAIATIAASSPLCFNPGLPAWLPNSMKD
jgi:hypothetical protein